MNARRLIATAPAGLAASAEMVVPAAVPALTAPPADGCPAEHKLRPAQTLAAGGSKTPADADSPASGVASGRQGGMGQSGDGGGFVCGVKLGGQLIPFGLLVGNFIGNQFAPLT
jgi:hypothetical protein